GTSARPGAPPGGPDRGGHGHGDGLGGRGPFPHPRPRPLGALGRRRPGPLPGQVLRPRPRLPPSGGRPQTDRPLTTSTTAPTHRTGRGRLRRGRRRVGLGIWFGGRGVEIVRAATAAKGRAVLACRCGTLRPP